jgi:hypothetical protein
MLNRFASHLASLGLSPGRAIVAVSGGPDSVALLDLLLQSRQSHQLDLLVAHADHGISLESGDVPRGRPAAAGPFRSRGPAGPTPVRPSAER